MSTIVLTSVGNYIGGPLGGAIGAYIGSWIDAKTNYLGLGPKQEPSGRMSLLVQSANEGSPVHFCMGPENRLCGTLIWCTELIETVAGGKGGSQAEEKYVYYVSLAVAICEGEIQSVEKIWADGKLVYDADPDVNITDNRLSIEKTSIVIIYGWETGVKQIMTINSPNGGPDLSECESGQDIVITGATNPGNNGTFRVRKRWYDYNEGTSHVEIYNEGVVAESAGASINLFQDLDEGDVSKLADVAIYTGSLTQNADTLIESYEGAGNVPAYRGTAYAVFENFNITDFGNRIPNFTFLVKADTTKTIAQALGSLLERAGLEAADYDVTFLSGSIRGLITSGPQPVDAAIRAIMLAYNIVVHESSGKLVFVPRTSLTTYAVDEDDLAIHTPDSEPSYVARFTEGPPLDLPQEVDVQFIEAAANYQPGSQRERRNDTLSSRVETIDTPLVMEASDARAIARRILWTIWGSSRKVEFTLPPKYLDLEPNDVVLVTIEEEDYEILVQQVSIGSNFLVEVVGVVVETQTENFDGVSESPDIFTTMVYRAPDITYEIIDVSLLRDIDVLTPGFYYVLACSDSGAVWRGASLYESLDNNTFNEVKKVRAEGVLGRTSGTLGDGPYGIWDEGNTIDVVMTNGTLESRTVLEVLNERNWAIIGKEIIAYKTATLVSTGHYTLSGLLRGRRGTENEIDSHAANERFVLLDQSGLAFREMSRSSLNTTRYYKGVGVGGVVAGVVSDPFTLQGGTLKPFSPCGVRVVRVNNDMTIMAQSRTRSSLRPFSEQVVDSNMPDVDFVGMFVEFCDNDSDWTVLRTKELTSGIEGFSTTYSAVEQTADGLTPGDPVNMILYQRSNTIFRGFERRVIL